MLATQQLELAYDIKTAILLFTYVSYSLGDEVRSAIVQELMQETGMLQADCHTTRRPTNRTTYPDFSSSNFDVEKNLN